MSYFGHHQNVFAYGASLNYKAKHLFSPLQFHLFRVILLETKFFGGPLWSLLQMLHSSILVTITFLLAKSNSDLCCIFNFLFRFINAAQLAAVRYFSF